MADFNQAIELMARGEWPPQEDNGLQNALRSTMGVAGDAASQSILGMINDPARQALGQITDPFGLMTPPQKSEPPKDPALAKLQQANDLVQKAEAVALLTDFKAKIDSIPDTEDIVFSGAKMEEVHLAPQKQQAFLDLASRGYNKYIAQALPTIENQLREEQNYKQQYLQNMRLVRKQEEQIKSAEDKERKKAYLKATADVTEKINMPGGVTAAWGQKYIDELTRQFQSGEDLDFGRAYKLASTSVVLEDVDPAMEDSITPDQVGPGKQYELINPDGSRNAEGYKYKRRTESQLSAADYRIPIPRKVKDTRSNIYQKEKGGQFTEIISITYDDGTTETIERPLESGGYKPGTPDKARTGRSTGSKGDETSFFDRYKK